MKSGFKIIVQSSKFFYNYLKDNLNNIHEVMYFKTQNKDFFSNCKNTDVLITMSWGKSMFGGKRKTSIIPQKNLKLLHLPGAGYDGIDFSKISKKTKVCNVYGHEVPIAEYCIANILSWEINLINKANNFKKLDWKDSLIFGAQPHGELYNKKIGILGYGKIGKEISKKLYSFNTKVITFTRKRIKKNSFLSAVHLSSDIKKYIQSVDYLIIACTLNASTESFIDKDILNLMKNTAVIVNVARGEIVNEKDLFFALRSNKIGGAITDTWYRYPSPLNKKFKPSTYDFNKLKNIIMTPHVSAWSKNMVARRAELIKKNIDNLYSNKKLYNEIDFSSF